MSIFLDFIDTFPWYGDDSDTFSDPTCKENGDFLSD